MTRPSRPSRRGFLAGTGLAVLGAAGGVTAGLLVDRSPDEVQPPNPAVLLAAVGAERALLRHFDTVSGGGSLHRLLQQIRADHEAHLAALLAAATLAAGASPSAVPTAALGPPMTRDELRAAESAAARAAAQRALTLTGPDAALLASIAACEATHAELLS